MQSLLKSHRGYHFLSCRRRRCAAHACLPALTPTHAHTMSAYTCLPTPVGGWQAYFNTSALVLAEAAIWDGMLLSRRKFASCAHCLFQVTQHMLQQGGCQKAAFEVMGIEWTGDGRTERDSKSSLPNAALPVFFFFLLSLFLFSFIFIFWGVICTFVC